MKGDEMTGHTPGEWEAIPPAKVGKRWTVGARGVLGGDGPTAGLGVRWNVARVDNGAPGDSLETEAANARLIASAPDLLAACEAAIREWDARPFPLHAQGDVADLIRAAVAKAKG